MFSIRALAYQPLPPPQVPLCEIEDKWLGQYIGTSGTLSRIDLVKDPTANPANMAIADPVACSDQKPILVDTSSASDCLYGQKGPMWDRINFLRDPANKVNASVKLFGEVDKPPREKYRYMLHVSCIEEIKINETPNNRPAPDGPPGRR